MVPSTNVIENIIQTKKPFLEIDDLVELAKPRPAARDVGQRIKLRTPWSFRLSVFRDYRMDTAKLLANCFEVDWGNSKIEKFLRKEEEAASMK